MGVPSFYKWLLNKYPKIVSDAVEEKGEQVDCSSKNPNGVEFDNFYLDMNGIIHPCFHPDDNLFPPTTFEEVFNSVFEYVDRLFVIVRPRKLLYMAIDGVAPRAKMNQQRGRRFRAAKDIQLLEEMEDKLRKQFSKEGKVLLPKQESQVADWNVITPGTEFMNMLSKKLRSFIRRRMSEDPAWRKIKVILSDDNVPGEGEHKIMSFIRAQRSSPGYDPNTRHCLYGLDADLIMLALATHEIHFSVLREEVLSPKVELSSEVSLGHNICKPEQSKSRWQVNKWQTYQFLNVWVLREYLAFDMKITSPPEKFEYDFERIIDEFIFICFFAGNDFLPHMPSLEIHEGCIDLLMHVYKKEFQNLGGYLVDMCKVEDKKGGFIKLKRVERFILSVGTFEEKIFGKRSQVRERKLRRILAEHRDTKDDEKNDIEDGRVSDVVCSFAGNVDVVEELKMSSSAGDVDVVLNNTKELKQKLKNYIRDQSDLFKDGSLGTDKVKFGSPGWRERYYREKFCAQSPDEIKETRKNVVAKYCEGICWVLLYYFCRVPSWTWFYPYHYGPFASDLKGLSQVKVKFQEGLPFKPFDQLMGVLPPRSAHALPIAYKGLMIDKDSTIIDFYPTEFETDVDGKRFMWQGICKLPFIEEERLLIETRKLENELKDFEKIRNSQSLDRLFVSREVIFYSRTRAESKKIKDAIMMDSTIEGIKGTLHAMPEDLTEAIGDNKGEHTRNYIRMFYEINQNFEHIPQLLGGVNIPEKTVYEEDIMETVLWHEYRGNGISSNGNRFRNQRPMIKPEHKWDQSRRDHAPASVYIGAGYGFSTLGRGKTSAVSKPGTFCRDYDTRDHHRQNHAPTVVYKAASYGFSTYGRGKSSAVSKPGTFCRDYGNARDCQPSSARTEYNEIPRAGHSRMDDYGGIEHLQISGTSQCSVTNDRPRQADPAFWKSRGGVAFDRSKDWRSNGMSGDIGKDWRLSRTSGDVWNKSSPNVWKTNVDSSGRLDRQAKPFSRNTGGG